MKFASMLALLLCFVAAYAKEPVSYPDIQGKIIQEIPYTDNTGNNVIVLTASETHGLANKYGDYEVYLKIFAYRFHLDESGGITKEWRVFDKLDCNTTVDYHLSFIQPHIHITDLNKNGIKEIWLPYSAHCAGDVSPDTIKIIAYEGTQKYAVRGRSRVSLGFDADNNRPTYEGGEYKMDSVLKNNPTFRKFAQKLWKKLVDE